MAAAVSECHGDTATGNATMQHFVTGPTCNYNSLLLTKQNDSVGYMTGPVI
jgi:hypothetical protein